VDRQVVREIIRLAGIRPDDIVLEVGSGLGNLTFLLARKAQKVVALERDERLYRLLRDRLAFHPNVELIQADALFFDYSSLGAGWKIVSNLPYSISIPLLFKFLQCRERVTEMVLMFQKEVADRLVSPPGRKSYGPLSLAIQLYCRVNKCLRVPPSAFRPKPKVESSVVQFRFLERPKAQLVDEELFFQIVRAAFTHRRKTLRNNLCGIKRSLGGQAPGFWEDACCRVGIDPSRRGETLSLEEFAALSNQMASLVSFEQNGGSEMIPRTQVSPG
jgi:16S rRNA (adenine1518-N6/adenine1519-N6)-dimethyltransferase